MSLMNSALVRQLTPGIQKAINLALSMDPGARKRLQPLRGCILEIRVTTLNHSVFITTESDQIVILPSADQATVTLSGSTMAFAKLASYRDKSSLFRSRDISLTGDAVRAQQLQRFARDLNVDWEAILAEVIGDVPAHAIGTSIRNTLTWGKHVSRSLKQDLEEFIKYELRLLPGKAIARHQFESIDQLRLASDRLEARVRKLMNKTGNH